MKHLENVALKAIVANGLILLAVFSSVGFAADPIAPVGAGFPTLDAKHAWPGSDWAYGPSRAYSPTPERMVMPSPSQRLIAPTVSAERPVLAVDVDETLSVTDYQNLVWGIGKDDGTPLPGAQAALSNLARTFDIVYVTARSRSMKNKTERWLTRHGFPAGRLVTSPTLGDFLFQGNFKEKVIRKLRQEYPNLVVGIGDKAKDGSAYRKGGMVSVIVNPWPSHKYHNDDVVLRDWSAVSAFFRANHDVLSNPRLFKQSLRSGRPTLDLSSEAREFQGRS